MLNGVYEFCMGFWMGILIADFEKDIEGDFNWGL